MKYTAGNAGLDEIFNLRHKVLRQGKPLESARFEVDEKPATRHFAVRDEQDKVVVCITAAQSSWENEPAWQLRGMATDPEYQGKGLGRLLLEFLEKELSADSFANMMWCNARKTAFVFYEKCGWEYASDEFEVPGIGPHKKMKKSL